MCLSAEFCSFANAVSDDSVIMTHVLVFQSLSFPLHQSAQAGNCTAFAFLQHIHCASTVHTLWILVCRKFDFFPKGTAGADGWMSLYFKFADQFSDNQQIGFGFKLHVINFQFPSQTLTKGVWMKLPDSCCACSVASWGLCCAVCATMCSSLLNSGTPDQYIACCYAMFPLSC